MSHNRNQSKIFWGATIIFIGVLALLDNLRLFDLQIAMNFWPLIFVAMGIRRILWPRHRGSYITGGVLALFGIGIILQNMGLIYVRWRDLWPVFIILAGIMVMSKGVFGGVYILRRDRGNRRGRYDLADRCATTEQSTSDNSSIDIATVMSGHNLKNNSQEFRGGDISAVMGSVELDLRQASFEGQANIKVSAIWGSVMILVPTDWTVVMNGAPILGSIDDRSVPPMTQSKRLLIDAEVVMAGIEIKN